MRSNVMAVTTACHVADYLIRFLAQRGDRVTNLKFQKLLYYAQVQLALYIKGRDRRFGVI